FFQAEDGIRDFHVTGVQTCALPILVLLETTVTTAALVAERIRARVAGETFGEGRMSLSIGVAECPAHGDTPETLIASADAAMYQAKAGGRDRVVAVGGQPEKEKQRRG